MGGKVLRWYSFWPTLCLPGPAMYWLVNAEFIMPLMFGKFSTLFFWLMVVLSWALDWPGVLSWLPTCGLVIAVVHVLEVLYFWLVFRGQSADPVRDAAMIMVFGIFHLRPFVEEAQTTEE